MPTNSLEGRRIIITGGASGMGESLVRALPALGAKIVSMDISEDSGRRIVREADAVGFVKVDVSDKASTQDAVFQAVERLGGIDVLIHAAGIAPGATSEDTPLDMWHAVMTINSTGTFLMNQAVFPYLKDGGGGAIINFASAAGVVGLPLKAAYSASKGAVLAWGRAIAVEWAKYNISVNAIA